MKKEGAANRNLGRAIQAEAERDAWTDKAFAEVQLRRGAEDRTAQLERERNVFALACEAFIQAYPWWDEAIESPAVKEAIALAAANSATKAQSSEAETNSDDTAPKAG